jgi:dynein heavy chain
MGIKKEKAEAELATIQHNLAVLTESLAKLNAQKKEKTDILNDLEAKADKMARRLNSADKLITGLGSEQKRWTIDMKNFQEDKIRLVGDCLTASSFLSYLGPFNFTLRRKMLFEDWKVDLAEKEIPSKGEDFRLENFLTDDVETARWASEGLPSDELSIQNGILTNQSSRWPLCIDP